MYGRREANTYNADTYLPVLNLLYEVKKSPPKSRIIHGQYSSPFNDILNRSTRQLRAISPNLPTRYLLPLNYLLNYSGEEGSFNAVQTYASLSEEENLEIERIRITRDRAIESFVLDKLLLDLSPQTIPQGLLEDVPYHWGTSLIHCRRACVSSAAAMVIDAVTGGYFNEIEMQAAYRTVFTDREMDEEAAYMAMMQTDRFQQRFGMKVRTIELFGVNFNNITRVATKLKARDPKLKIYGMLSLRSEKTDYSWHNVILLSANEELVTVHDNAFKTGVPYRELYKDYFAQRWGRAYSRGQLVIAKPT